MADVKISALPAATVALAGTEVLPIVQSATTRQVSVANLTAGRAVNALSLTASSLTSGRVTYAGASGLLTDSATLTYNGTTLTASTGAAFATTSGNVNIGTSSIGGKVSILQGTAATPALTTDVTNAVGSIWHRYTTASGVNQYMDITLRSGTEVEFTTSSKDISLLSNSTFVVKTSGSVGIGTASPVSKLDVTGQVTATGGIFKANGAPALSAATAGEAILAPEGTYGAFLYGRGTTYDVTIGQRSTGVALGVLAGTNNITATGIVTMSIYGAGAATFSAAGVISSVSDETWKTKDGVPTNTDAMLQKLEPGYWFYNEEKAPIFGQDRQLGFYAQNVHEAIGAEAAPTPDTYKDADGNDVSKPWGYYDRSVLAVAVMSLKNALNTIEELKQRITALENK